MKIYLISLPNSLERREILKQRFPRHYDKFIMINAVEGKKLSCEEYFNLIKCLYSKTFLLMTPGEVGCALSHMKAYEHLIRSGDECALILEDDVIGNDENIEKVQNLLPELLKSYGDNFVWIVGGMEGLSKKYFYVKKTTVPDVYTVHKLSKRYIYRAVCYVVTKSIAKQILENQRKCLAVADWWNFILPRNTVILYSSILKHPIEQESLIEAERVQVRVRISRRKVLIPIIKEWFSVRFGRALLKFSKIFGYRKLI